MTGVTKDVNIVKRSVMQGAIIVMTSGTGKTGERPDGNIAER
jgi:hypothetical protein